MSRIVDVTPRRKSGVPEGYATEGMDERQRGGGYRVLRLVGRGTQRACPRIRGGGGRFDVGVTDRAMMKGLEERVVVKRVMEGDLTLAPPYRVCPSAGNRSRSQSPGAL